MFVYLMLFFTTVDVYLIHTNIKQFQGLHKALHLLHKEHMHLFSWYYMHAVQHFKAKLEHGKSTYCLKNKSL